MEENIEQQPKKKRQKRSKAKIIAETIENLENPSNIEDKEAVIPQEKEEVGGTVKRIGTVTRYIADTGVYEFSRMYKKVKYATANRYKRISGGFVVTILPSDEDGKPLSTSPIATFKNISIEEAFSKIGYTLQ